MSAVVRPPRPTSTYVATGAKLIELPRKAPETPSVLESQRFNLPVNLLEEALAEAFDRTSVAPNEQVLPRVEAIDEALALLEILPADMPCPEPVVEPSGTIVWAWDGEAHKFLALGVDGSGRLQRSAVLSGQEFWGTAPMIGRLSADELDLLNRFRAPHA